MITRNRSLRLALHKQGVLIAAERISLFFDSEKFCSSFFKSLRIPKAEPLVAFRRKRNTCRGGKCRHDHSVFFQAGGECHQPLANLAYAFDSGGTPPDTTTPYFLKANYVRLISLNQFSIVGLKQPQQCISKFLEL